jgi:hypothetical protein
LRDINKNEEITIFYLAMLKSRETRLKTFQKKFGFKYAYHLCSLPPKQNLENDKRLNAIHHLDDLIGQGSVYEISSSPARILRYVDGQVRLYNDQGPDNVDLPRAFFDAAQIAIANSDLAKGRIFIERAVSGWQAIYGGDSPEVIKNKAFA